MSLASRAWQRNAFNFISDWVLPAGLFCLLTGLAWLGERNQYHKLFYALMAAPALIAFLLQPAQTLRVLRTPVTLAFIAFSAWALLSIAWSTTDESVSSLLKRPLYILMLFVACALMARDNCSRLLTTVHLAALLMIPIVAYSLVDFARHYTEGARLIGSGALDNPLLSSHLFGFFCILWLGYAMTAAPRNGLVSLLPLALLFMALLATGSRTPLIAVAIASIWLVACCWDRRAMLLAATGVIIVTCLLMLYPESLLNRGTSYRFDIWQLALEKIQLHPLIGHGFDAPVSFVIPELGFALSEPHNFFLGVLFYTGLVGGVCWLLMHASALWICWHRRSDVCFIIAGALVLYGLGAGLTEGGGILPRPKEHWLLTWIPLAWVATLSIGHQEEKST
ncbi:O-antigen ligase [Pseudomonas sp. SLBN-26]|uniref:O-antigen ligase family protein n=1 Tax=Pseudomonadaceae TaxID=135621 RepID=UPI00117242EF|nr:MULTISPECIES: O-antigen ligase family protein [Pseudomonas]MCP1619907.1 O-antigen ligase [Pseudomonas otitidis]TQL09130.1 O-antigen ligase [Pseudomonas sp. SLBN-26]